MQVPGMGGVCVLFLPPIRSRPPTIRAEIHARISPLIVGTGGMCGSRALRQSNEE